MQNNSLFGLQKTENQTNFNKLVGWIFLFSGILKYVENKCAGLAECEEADIPKTLFLTTVLSEAYPPFIVEKLMRFMLDMKKLRVEQEKTDDYCGENSALDNMFFQECILS